MMFSTVLNLSTHDKKDYQPIPDDRGEKASDKGDVVITIAEDYFRLEHDLIYQELRRKRWFPFVANRTLRAHFDALTISRLNDSLKDIFSNLLHDIEKISDAECEERFRWIDRCLNRSVKVIPLQKIVVAIQHLCGAGWDNDTIIEQLAILDERGSVVISYNQPTPSWFDNIWLCYSYFAADNTPSGPWQAMQTLQMYGGIIFAPLLLTTLVCTVLENSPFAKKHLNNGKEFDQVYVLGIMILSMFSILILLAGYKYFRPIPQQIKPLKNLTLDAKSRPFQPLIGREEPVREVLETFQTTSSAAPTYPLLVGPSGVGKSMLMEYIAYLLAYGLILNPELKKKMKGVTFFMGCGSDFADQGANQNEPYDKLDHFRRTVNPAKDRVILAIDEIHAPFKNKKKARPESMKKLCDGGSDSIPYLMGATTNKEYRLYIATDTALANRFRVIYMKRLKKDPILNILRMMPLTYLDSSSLTEAFLDYLYERGENFILRFPAHGQPKVAKILLSGIDIAQEDALKIKQQGLENELENHKWNYTIVQLHGDENNPENQNRILKIHSQMEALKKKIAEVDRTIGENANLYLNYRLLKKQIASYYSLLISLAGRIHRGKTIGMIEDGIRFNLINYYLFPALKRLKKELDATGKIPTYSIYEMLDFSINRWGNSLLNISKSSDQSNPAKASDEQNQHVQASCPISLQTTIPPSLINLKVFDPENNSNALNCILQMIYCCPELRARINEKKENNPLALLLHRILNTLFPYKKDLSHLYHMFGVPGIQLQETAFNLCFNKQLDLFRIMYTILHELNIDSRDEDMNRIQPLKLLKSFQLGNTSQASYILTFNHEVDLSITLKSAPPHYEIVGFINFNEQHSSFTTFMKDQSKRANPRWFKCCDQQTLPIKIKTVAFDKVSEEHTYETESKLFQNEGRQASVLLFKKRQIEPKTLEPVAAERASPGTAYDSFNNSLIPLLLTPLTSNIQPLFSFANIGNSCYINSVLQLLFLCRPFIMSLDMNTKDVLLRGILDFNKIQRPTREHLREWRELLFQRWEQPKGSLETQHDPHELLIKLLEWFDRSNIFKLELSKVFSAGEVHENQISHHNILPLPLIHSGLQENIQAFFSPKREEGTENHWRNHSQWTEQYLISGEPPPYIFLQLLRFVTYLDGHGHLQVNKDNREVHLSDTGRVELRNKQDQMFQYEIIGIANHEGNSTAAGHYTTYIKRHEDQRWIHCNDAEHRFEDPTNSSRNSYLILLKRMD